MCNCCTRTQKLITGTVIGFLLIGVSIFFYNFYDDLIEWQTKKALVLSSDSYAYDFWKDVPIPVFYYIYLFNTTNAAQVLNGDDPILKELGPYVFSEHRTKHNITFNANGTVAYEQKKVYHFVADKSGPGLSPNDRITHLNVAILTALNLISKKFTPQYQPFMYNSINLGCTDKSTDCRIFLEHNVFELMFDGWPDPIIADARGFWDIPYDRFAYFIGRNNSAPEGLYNMFTGSTDINKLGFMDRWKHNRTIGHYMNHSRCDRFDHSTAGDFRPPYQMTESTDPIDVFVGEMCRSFKLVYLYDVENDGIDCMRYTGGPHLFDYKHPDNLCFCQQPPPRPHKPPRPPPPQCPPSGIANISSCAFDAPVFISYPHFLHADRILRQWVHGLTPNEDRHSFYMDFEPKLGIPMSASAKLQINILLEKNKNFNLSGTPAMAKLAHKELYYPQLWVDIKVDMDSDMRSKIKLIVKWLPIICDVIAILMLGTGIFLLLLVLYFQYCQKEFTRKTK